MKNEVVDNLVPADSVNRCAISSPIRGTNGRAYCLSSNALMKMLAAPPLSFEAEACSLMISVKRINAAAECKTGMAARVKTPATTWASRNVHVDDSIKGCRD